jgi:hypothetical protein
MARKRKFPLKSPDWFLGPPRLHLIDAGGGSFFEGKMAKLEVDHSNPFRTKVKNH